MNKICQLCGLVKPQLDVCIFSNQVFIKALQRKLELLLLCRECEKLIQREKEITSDPTQVATISILIPLKMISIETIIKFYKQGDLLHTPPEEAIYLLIGSSIRYKQAIEEATQYYEENRKTLRRQIHIYAQKHIEQVPEGMSHSQPQYRLFQESGIVNSNETNSIKEIKIIAKPTFIPKKNQIINNRDQSKDDKYIIGIRSALQDQMQRNEIIPKIHMDQAHRKKQIEQQFQQQKDYNNKEQQIWPFGGQGAFYCYLGRRMSDRFPLSSEPIPLHSPISLIQHSAIQVSQQISQAQINSQVNLSDNINDILHNPLYTNMQILQNKQLFIGPTPTTNWVIPKFLLMGNNPQVRDINLILQSDIEIFINLVRPYDEQDFDIDSEIVQQNIDTQSEDYQQQRISEGQSLGIGIGIENGIRNRNDKRGKNTLNEQRNIHFQKSKLNRIEKEAKSGNYFDAAIKILKNECVNILNQVLIKEKIEENERKEKEKEEKQIHDTALEIMRKQHHKHMDKFEGQLEIDGSRCDSNESLDKSITTEEQREQRRIKSNQELVEITNKIRQKQKREKSWRKRSGINIHQQSEEMSIQQRKYRQSIDNMIYIEFPMYAHQKEQMPEWVHLYSRNGSKNNIEKGNSKSDEDSNSEYQNDQEDEDEKIMRLVDWISTRIIEGRQCIFIHSEDGHGKPAVICSLVIARIFHAQCQSVYTSIQDFHNCRIKDGTLLSPQSHEQYCQIFRIINRWWNIEDNILNRNQKIMRQRQQMDEGKQEELQQEQKQQQIITSQQYDGIHVGSEETRGVSEWITKTGLIILKKLSNQKINNSLNGSLITSLKTEISSVKSSLTQDKDQEQSSNPISIPTTNITFNSNKSIQFNSNQSSNFNQKSSLPPIQQSQYMYINPTDAFQNPLNAAIVTSANNIVSV